MCEAVKRTPELSPRRHSWCFLCLLIHLIGVWIQTPPFIISDGEGIGAAFIKIKKKKFSTQVRMQRSQRFSWTTWEGCCCHCQETWPHVWNLVLTFNHIVKHWYHVLHDTLYCLLHRSCSSKGDKVFFHSLICLLSPQLGFLHRFTRYTDEKISPSLASHLKSRTHLKCTAVWNASIICLTCLKLIC